MHRHSLYIQTHDRPGSIYRGLMDTASKALSGADYDSLTVVIAYASVIGCRLLVEGLARRMRSWDQVRKRWIISVDRAITAPDALVFLAELPNSEVRVPTHGTSSAELLGGPVRFHPKLYLFESRSDRERVALFSGSSNLTQGGLYFNAEQATAFVLTPPITKLEKPFLLNLRRQRTIIEKVFGESLTLSDDLLKEYRALWRPSNLPRVERTRCTNALEPKPVIDRSQAISLASADAFWVKVTNKVVENRGKGKPGNQIDLHPGSRVFFGFGVSEVPRNTAFGQARIRFEGATDSFTVRFGNNYMDKINLPLLENPRTYAAKTLLFTRTADGVYDLTIGDSRLARSWREKSRSQGTIYRMQSGRPYGVFSTLN